MVVYDEPKNSKRVDIGDVITSPLFQFGTQYLNTYPIKVGDLYVQKHPNSQSASIDETRATALYVVNDARKGGGGIVTPHAHISPPLPDGWQVTARRLDENSIDDGNGELILFYQEASWLSNNIPEVMVVGKMQQIFK